MSTFEWIAVTARNLCTGPLPEQLARILSGADAPDRVILREKDLDEAAYRRLASEVLVVCDRYHVPLILHTYPETAQALGCPRIHLPFSVFQERWQDLAGFELRGTSIHSASDARWAAEHGANYVTAGHIYATDCKAGLPPRGLDFLRDVCRAVSIPVYAIGGVSKECQEDLASAGAAGGCMMSWYMRR